MQKCVRKLILEVLVIKEQLNAASYLRHFKYLVNGRSASGIFLQHACDELLNLIGVTSGDLVVLSFQYALRKLVQTCRIKWWTQGTHFVEQDTEGPDVRLETIRLILNNFG